LLALEGLEERLEVARAEAPGAMALDQLEEDRGPVADRLREDLQQIPLLVSVDMDLSVDIGFVGTAVDLLETNDIVVGSKKMGNQNRSLFRRLGSDSFLQATRLLLGLTYDDYSIAAKGFRVDVVRRFVERINEGSSYVLEICYLTKRAGGRIVQVPVTCEDWRQSKFNLWHEAVYKYSHLVRLWLREWRRGVERIDAR